MFQYQWGGMRVFLALQTFLDRYTRMGIISDAHLVFVFNRLLELPCSIFAISLAFSSCQQESLRNSVRLYALQFHAINIPHPKTVCLYSGLKHKNSSYM